MANLEQNSEKLEVLWTVDMVSAYFSVHKQTVYNWINKGKIKTVHVGTRAVRIPKSEVERMIGESKKKLKQ